MKRDDDTKLDWIWIVWLVGILLLAAACNSTPEPIRAGSKMERNAIVQGKADVQSIYDAVLTDLMHSWRTSIETVALLDAQINSKDGKVDLKIVRLRLRQAMLRVKVASLKIALYQEFMASSYINFDVGLRIHDKMDSWMGRSGLSPETQQAMVAELGEIGSLVGTYVDKKKLNDGLADINRMAANEAKKIAEEEK